MVAVVEKTLGGHTFRVLAPAGYPYGNGTFDEEEPILAPWRAMAAPGRLLVDVGASFGAFVLPALAAGARVIAFEPSDDGHRILSENVYANGWQGRGDLRQVAVFDGEPYPHDLHSWVFGTSYPAPVVNYSTLDRELACQSVSDLGIAAIKIDIEGGELGCLRGATGILRRFRPLLLIEDHAGICPGHVVSDYPESLGGVGAIAAFLAPFGYDLEQLEWGSGSRKYIVARGQA